MAYVDGFVIPLPKENLEAYLDMSRQCGAIWKEYGALEFRECVGDDIPPGKVTSFPLSVDLRDGEAVVFSWIVYASRTERDAINDKAHERSPHGALHGPEKSAFRRQAHDLRRLRMMIDL